VAVWIIDKSFGIGLAGATDKVVLSFNEESLSDIFKLQINNKRQLQTKIFLCKSVQSDVRNKILSRAGAPRMAKFEMTFLS
jgi:hypothetical protein